MTAAKHHSPHGMHAETCHLLLLSVTPSTKSTKFGSRYLVQGFSEGDEIWQIDRGGLAVPEYIRAKIGELWPRGSPGAP